MFAHFLAAQAPVQADVLAQLRAGHKRSHWMWFVFPQVAGLGQSAMSRQFALHSLDEARAFLAHPVLGPRLCDNTGAVLAHAGQLSAHAIFGSPDDRKFHSSMTLFARAAPDEPLFRRALDGFFDGEEDAVTLARL